jgi:hypothetical protein
MPKQRECHCPCCGSAAVPTYAAGPAEGSVLWVEVTRCTDCGFAVHYPKNAATYEAGLSRTYFAMIRELLELYDKAPPACDRNVLPGRQA